MKYWGSSIARTTERPSLLSVGEPSFVPLTVARRGRTVEPQSDIRPTLEVVVVSLIRACGIKDFRQTDRPVLTSRHIWGEPLAIPRCCRSRVEVASSATDPASKRTDAL